VGGEGKGRIEGKKGERRGGKPGKEPPPSKCVRTGLEVFEQGVGGARDGVWRGARTLSPLRALEAMSP